MSLLTNDAQTRLLFKQFMGVASTALEAPFDAETFNFVPNIFSKDIMIETIPDTPTVTINELDGSGPFNKDDGTILPDLSGGYWLDSSSNYATNSVEESTYFNSTNSTYNGKTYAEIFPDEKIKFFKRLSLVPVDSASNGRVWGSFSDYSGSLIANKNSILEHAIPFKFDDINEGYLPIVRKNDATPPSTNFQQVFLNQFPVYWLMDSGSGYLLFYAEKTDLESNNINASKTLANGVQNPQYAPTISCFVYNGKLGITNIDVSGQQQVADLSGVLGSMPGVDRMLLPDGSANIFDLCGNDAIRSQYKYVRKNLFVGYDTHPKLDVTDTVNHTLDPSHNDDNGNPVTYQLDVSGNSYFSRAISQGDCVANAAVPGTASFGASNRSMAQNSFSVGGLTRAMGFNSFSCGVGTQARNTAAFSQGKETDAGGAFSHAEGCFTSTSLGATAAHSEGFNTKAIGVYSHAEGISGESWGQASHASGQYTIIGTDYGTSIGKFNDTSENVLFVIGDGTSHSARSDAFYVNTDGNTRVCGNLDVSKNVDISGTLDVLGQTSLHNTSVQGDLEVTGVADINNIYLEQDMSMNGGQIKHIGDATDPSGVPSWGQVQQYSGVWGINGDDIYNTNIGNVGIGKVNPITELDVSGSTSIAHSDTLSSIDIDKHLYVRNTNLIDTLKIGFNTFFKDIWKKMLVQNIDVGNNGDSGATPTFTSGYGPSLIPIAYINIQQNNGPNNPPPDLQQRPHIANSLAYFTIKFGQPIDTKNLPQAPIDWKTAQLRNKKSFLGSITQQTIHFVAGYIDNYLDTGGNEGRNPKPFIKILSTNIINQKCLTGNTQNIADTTTTGADPFTEYNQSSAATPKIGGISRIVIAEGLPEPHADKEIQNKVWLCLEQTWNNEPWQGGGSLNITNEQALTDIVGEHIIDVKMYQNNTGNLDPSRNPNSPITNTDWQLVRENDIRFNEKYGSNKFILPMGQNTSSPEGLFGKIQLPIKNDYTLQVGDTNVLGNYPRIKSESRLWQTQLILKDWAYGITTTDEIFMKDVDICGNLNVQGNFNVMDSSFTNITVTNRGTFGPTGSILVGPTTSTFTGITNIGPLDNGTNDISCGNIYVGNGGSNGSNMSTQIIPRTDVPIVTNSQNDHNTPDTFEYYKLATINAETSPLKLNSPSGFFELNYYITGTNYNGGGKSALMQTVRFIAGATTRENSTTTFCDNIYIDVVSNQYQGGSPGSAVVDIKIKELVISCNDDNKIILYGLIHRPNLGTSNPSSGGGTGRYTMKLYQSSSDIDLPHNNNSKWKFIYGSNAVQAGGLPNSNIAGEYKINLESVSPDLYSNTTAPLDNMKMRYEDTNANKLTNSNVKYSRPTFFEQYVKFGKGIDISNTKIINARGLLGKNQYVIGNNVGSTPNSNDMHIESLGVDSNINIKVRPNKKITFIGRDDGNGTESGNSIDIYPKANSVIDMDFNGTNNIKNVNLLTVTDINAGDISANYISVVDLSVNKLDVYSELDMNNNYILNSKFVSIDLQNPSASSGGILTSYYNDGGTQKESVKIESDNLEGKLTLFDTNATTGMILDGYGNIKRSHTISGNFPITIKGNGTDYKSILRIDNENDISGSAKLLFGQRQTDSTYSQQIDVIYDYSDNPISGGRNTGTGDNNIPFVGIKGTGHVVQGGINSAYLICSPVTDGNAILNINWPDGKHTFGLAAQVNESSVIQIGDYHKPYVRIGGGQTTAQGFLSSAYIYTENITSDQSINGLRNLTLEGSGNQITLGPDAVRVGTSGDVELSSGGNMTTSNGQTTFMQDLFLNSGGVDIKASGNNSICNGGHTGKMGTFGITNGTELKGEDLKVGGNVSCSSLTGIGKFFNLYNQAPNAGKGDSSTFIKYCNVEAPQGLVVLRGQVQLLGNKCNINLDRATCASGTMIIPHSMPDNKIQNGTAYSMFQNFTVSVENAGLFASNGVEGACVNLKFDPGYTRVQAIVAVEPGANTDASGIRIEILADPNGTPDIFVNYRVEMERKDNFFGGKDTNCIFGQMDASISKQMTGDSFKEFLNTHTGSKKTYSAAADISGNYYS